MILMVTWMGVLSVLCVGILWFKIQTPRMAYVRSAVLIEKFKGMQDAQALYQKKLSGLQSDMDLRKAGIEQDIQQFEQEARSLSAQEREIRAASIRNQQTTLVSYEEQATEKAKEGEKIIRGAFNQINSLVEQYAKEKGYDLILGTTQDGSVLYGNQAIDITDEVVIYLNQVYK